MRGYTAKVGLRQPLHPDDAWERWLRDERLKELAQAAARANAERDDLLPILYYCIQCGLRHRGRGSVECGRAGDR